MKFQKKVNKYFIKDNYVIGYTTNSNEKFYIDLDDYEKIKNTSWYETPNGYIAHKDKSVIFLHRFVTDAPKDKIIDHINHNKKDNRKANLRITNYKVNGLNKKKIPKGIVEHQVGSKTYYMIQLNGYRGNFKTYEEALERRNQIIKNEYLVLRECN